MPHPFILLDKRILQQYGPKLAVFIAAINEVKADAEEERGVWTRDPNNSPTIPMAKDGAVPISNQELISYTGLSEFQLLNCKKLAEQEGLIKIDVRGIPGKLYYKMLGEYQAEVYIGRSKKTA